LVTGGIAANWGFRPPNLPFPVGGPGFLSYPILLGTTRISLPNGTSFRPTALAGFTSVTDDIHTNGQMDRPRYGNMCRNRRNRSAMPLKNKKKIHQSVQAIRMTVSISLSHHKNNYTVSQKNKIANSCSYLRQILIDFQNSLHSSGNLQ